MKKVCPICGAEFEAHHGLQKYCSKSCAQTVRQEEITPYTRQLYHFREKARAKGLRWDGDC